MRYLSIFISIILIFLGSALLNITINDEMMKNIMLKISGGFVMYFGIVILVKAINKEDVQKKNA
ncbi:hypothetical protein SAMN05880501_11942 [Ureibacillus xyleni]|uniref:Uncharacterized protein n=1 Tax=Ureibacillus xyleni TaxID=614648 RepID=A0A285TR66_9BACL|nr:hypothetical protein [Ureibacillus xyleni]SOC25715.1 hypothetical protein SAMN05880501_11942 [Ureibacillus xyleni]